MGSGLGSQQHDQVFMSAVQSAGGRSNCLDRPAQGPRRPLFLPAPSKQPPTHPAVSVGAGGGGWGHLRGHFPICLPENGCSGGSKAAQ